VAGLSRELSGPVICYYPLKSGLVATRSPIPSSTGGSGSHLEKFAFNYSNE